MLLIEERVRLEAGKKGVLKEISKIKDTLPLMQERMKSYQKLAAEGLAPRVEALRLQEELITRERDLEIAEGRILETDSGIAAAERRLLLLQRQFRRDALAELAEAEAIRSDRKEAMKKALVRNSWQTIRAPVDGTIVGTQVFTIGDVIEPGAPLMMIAPKDQELIVEAMILNKDIGFVRLGDPVAVKLEAYPFTRYGLIDGELTMISADAMVDERMGPVFLAEVKLSQPYVGEGNLKRDIQSGMNATAEVKTGDRRIIDFILSPIAKASSEAARER
jgi:hemolysin D